MPTLYVHFLPELVEPVALAGSCCVVVDVLRATSTIVEALAAEAVAVVPCLTIEDARKRADDFPFGLSLLGGERGGRPIVGFALGNSPAEYTASRVAGKTVLLTTTNGTKALLRCSAADEVLVGAFTNLSAVCEHLQQNIDFAGRPVHIICAGTDGQITREDVLFAGAVSDRLAHGGNWQLDDSAEVARDAWRSVAEATLGTGLGARLVAAFETSRGGRNLIEIGMAGDLELAAQVDRHRIVPRFDSKLGRIWSPGDTSQV